jgi:hypothetical protein
MTDADDVGGYVTQYAPPSGTGSFTFTTVRGSGHMVPQVRGGGEGASCNCGVCTSHD